MTRTTMRGTVRNYTLTDVCNAGYAPHRFLYVDGVCKARFCPSEKAGWTAVQKYVPGDDWPVPMGETSCALDCLTVQQAASAACC